MAEFFMALAIVSLIGIGIALGHACHRMGYAKGWADGHKAAEDAFDKVWNERVPRLVAALTKGGAA